MKINAYMARMNKAYLFADIAHRVDDYRAANPEKEIIRLGIGDVTKPLTPHVAKAFADSALSMGTKEGFRGYPPYEGYDFLLDAIIEQEYAPLGVKLSRKEIFVSDGAKTDTGSIQELFSPDTRVAVTDPVYPVYVDSNAMAGRLGFQENGIYPRLITLPCTPETGFAPVLPDGGIDVLYLCSPNNPTGAALTYDQLTGIVRWANRHQALIVFDAAYKAYITEKNIPHSIFEIEGARTCAVECCSFSKNAGFTGVRCAYTVIPEELMGYAAALDDIGQKEVAGLIEGYLGNARIIREGLAAAGFTVYGGVNSPYVWLKTPEGMGSWQFFDELLSRAQVVGTPGAGFGAAGEGYLRLTAFNTPENTQRAVERIVRAF